MRKLIVLTFAAFALATTGADAHQSPMGCFKNALNLDLSRDRASVHSGETVTYTVRASNVGAGACDITDAVVTFAAPTADGTPTSTPTTLDADLDLPADSAERVIGTVSWTAIVNAGVTAASASVAASAVLHDSGSDHPANVSRAIGVEIAEPKLGLTVTPTATTGTAPLSVTFHFALANLSTPPLTSPAVDFPQCSTPAAYASGDDDANGAIDAGEVWDLTCTRVFTEPSTYSATTVASASASGGLLVSATAPATTIHVTAPVSTAHLTLTKVASPLSGVAPLSVTYTYTVLNDGPSTPISGITVTDAGCATVTSTAPSTPLAAGASRTFTCTVVYPDAGTYSSGAIASGTDTVTNTLVSSAAASAEVTASLPTDTETTAAALPDDPAPTPVPATTATPTPTPAATPVPSTRVTFAFTGRFTPARSCRDTVTLTLKAGTKSVATKRVKLDGKCRYKVSFNVDRTRLGTAKNVTVTAKAKAGKRTASRRLSVPRL